MISRVTLFVQQCLANLETLLNELGLGMSHIIRMTIYLTDYQDFEAINTVYAQRLTPPFPAQDYRPSG